MLWEYARGVAPRVPKSRAAMNLRIIFIGGNLLQWVVEVAVEVEVEVDIAVASVIDIFVAGVILGSERRIFPLLVVLYR